MNTQTFTIQKKGGIRKGVIFVQGPETFIPEKLKESIILSETGVTLPTCKENPGRFIAYDEQVKDGYPVGVYIGYEDDPDSKTGINCWFKENGQWTLKRYPDGTIHEKTAPVQAVLVDWDEENIPFPEADVEYTAAGVSIYTHHDDPEKVQHAERGKRYAFGHYQDGSFSLMSLDAPSVAEYYVLDESGEFTDKRFVDVV